MQTKQTQPKDERYIFRGERRQQWGRWAVGGGRCLEESLGNGLQLNCICLFAALSGLQFEVIRNNLVGQPQKVA